MFKKGDKFKEYVVVDEFDTEKKNVFLVSKNCEKFVLKVLRGGMNDEIKIGKTLGAKCPFLVQIFEVIVVNGGKDMCIIMEYCEGGDLSNRIKKNKPPMDMEIYRFVYEGTVAIHTLHKAGVVHRDVKPANFFLIKSEGSKLGDYGISRIMDSSSSKTMTATGTPGYVSPEILEGVENYSSKVDIYSFGVTLLEFITGRHPFSNENGSLNMNRIIHGNPIDAALNHSHPCARIARRMIALDPTVRPSSEDILAGVGFYALPLLAPLHVTIDENAKLKNEILELKKKNLPVIVSQNFHTSPSSAPKTTSSSVVELAYPTAKDRYVGSVRGAVPKPHGRGKCWYANGNEHKCNEEYEGDWVDGVREGRGTQTWSDGDRYEGDFAKGWKEGKGIYTSSVGGVDVGSYVNNKIEGKGVRKLPNEDVYVGDFVAGKIQGKGTWKLSNGDVYVGDFVEGKMQGKGTLTLANGGVYRGDFFGGRKEGKGTYLYPDGQIYLGDFKGNKRSGYGILKDKEGNVIYEGFWRDNDQV